MENTKRGTKYHAHKKKTCNWEFELYERGRNNHVSALELRKNMRFGTKKELLKHLGKNEDDRKLIDRLIAKWEVYKENGMYVIGESREAQLEKEIKSLKEQLSKNTTNTSGKNTTLPDTNYEKKLKELESDLDFQMKEYERLEKQTKEEVWMYQECIRKCYLWAINEKKIKITRPDFRDNVLKLKKSLPGEDNQ